MRKCVRIFLTLLFCLMLTVNVYADEAGKSQKPDIITDYYMVVESPDGGADFYAGASFGSTRLNNAQIPNGTAVHIEGEKTDENQRVWGYTQYRGMYGYVPEDDLRVVTRSEAIESELYLAGADNVDYNADYDVEPRDDAGIVYLYQGPGEKYGRISGNSGVPAGSKLRVFEDAELADGSHWAQVRTEDGTEGWVNMNLMKPYGTEDSNAVNGEIVNMEATGTEAETPGTEDSEAEEAQEGDFLAAGKADLTPTPSVTVTPTPKPTATPTPTVEPTASPTPTAEPTEEPTPTAEPTEEPTPTAKPTEEPTPTAEPTEEPTPAEEAVNETVTPAAESQEVSAGQVSSVSSVVRSPFFWILIVVIVAVIVLLVYHFKKRDK